MKLHHETSPLETYQPLTNTTAFGIEINEFTFDLLIKKLYSNPINSIVRELVSNAWDSHIDAGHTHLAVIVNAPTHFDPHFTVRDFGTGLSHEAMTSLYNMLCASNRRDSNAALGGYGLGSKSPFSYTDQFTVESRFNGWNRQYAVYKNEANIPTLTLMDTTATDELNGLTVRIPVQRSDTYTFNRAIEDELAFFPNLQLNIPTTPLVPLWTSTTPNNALITRTTARFNGNLYALIGPIIYKVDTDNLFKTNTANLTSTWNWKGNLFLHLPIGSVSITPNREELQYNAATVHTLETAVLNAKDEIDTYLKTAIPACPTYNAACKQFGPLRTALKSIGWWNDSYTHPEKPSEPISSYLAIALDDGIDVGIVKQGRRCRLSLDHWVHREAVRLDLDTTYQVLWAPAKTPYLTQRIRTYTGNYNNKILAIRGGNRNEIMEKLNTELLIPVTSIDLSHIAYSPPRTRSSISGTFKTIDEKTVYATDINDEDDAFVRIDNGQILANEKTYYPSTISVANKVVREFPNTHGFRWIIQLPKSRWNAKITKTLINAVPSLIEQLKHLVTIHHDTLIKVRSLQALKNHYNYYLSRCSAMQTPSKFIEGTKKYLMPPERFIHLLNAAQEFNIPIPDADPQFTAEALAFLERYKPLIKNEIDLYDYPELLTAYEQYLEQPTDV